MEFLLAILGGIVIWWLGAYILIPLFGERYFTFLVDSEHLLHYFAFFLTLAVLCVLYALYMSVTAFFTSFIQNINPYTTYVDKRPGAPIGARRNYFFGPGLHQVLQTIKGTFSNLGSHLEKLYEFSDRYSEKGMGLWSYFGYAFAFVCSKVLGSIWALILSVVYSVVMLAGMSGFYLFFPVLWLLDRAILYFKSIHNRCPKCKRRSVIPTFVCPTCGLDNRNLVPGVYGILHRRCACGTELATTFLGGRSKYEAHCPTCGAKLYSSESQQYGLQLVGGTEAGKTTFLTAFWHEYRKWLNGKIQGYRCEPEDTFKQLDILFSCGKSEATVETNANMYSIIHNLGNNKPTVQMTIYDIAGEVFNSVSSEMQQLQYQYCEGFLIIIDPMGTSTFTSSVVTNFIYLMNEMKGKHTSKITDIPVAVIISKGDLFKREIGLPKIKAEYKSRFEKNNTQQADDFKLSGFEQFRDEICREFLFKRSFDNVVNLLEAEFTNVRYFPISAIGHCGENGRYEPWGVLEPVFWLMRNEKCPLRDLVIGETET